MMETMIGMVGAALLAAPVSEEQEFALARWWMEAALLGREGPVPARGAGLEVRQQTYGTFRLNQSVWEQPLRLGRREYARGLGTHATSEVRVTLPQPGRRFRADVGVDRNPNTAGVRGSVVLRYRGGGSEAVLCSFRRPTHVQSDGEYRPLRGGQPGRWDRRWRDRGGARLDDEAGGARRDPGRRGHAR